MGRMETICRELGCEASEVFGMVLELVAATEELRAARVRAEQEVRAARAESWELMRAHLAGEAVDMEFMEAAREFWLDDPWSVNKVLGVEVVKADNPYGCNQHAHSWVGQCPYDVPQPGDEWKPPVRKKDKPGGGGGNDGEKGKPVGKKGEDVKNKPTSGELVYTRLSELFGKDVAEQFEEKLNAAPEWVRGFYVKHIGEAVEKIEKTRGISHQFNTSIAINEHSLKEKDWRPACEVLFHEIAHALDDLVTRTTKDFALDASYSSRVLHDTIKADYEALLKKLQEEETARAKKAIEKCGGKFSKELFEEAYKNGDLGQWTYDWHKSNPKAEHLPDIYIRELGAKDYTGRTPRISKSRGSHVLQKEINSKPRVLGAVCDAFNAKNGIELNVGHNKSYYKKWGGNADAMETFANLYAMYAENDKKVIADVERYLPSTCKKFKEMIKNNS